MASWSSQPGQPFINRPNVHYTVDMDPLTYRAMLYRGSEQAIELSSHLFVRTIEMRDNKPVKPITKRRLECYVEAAMVDAVGAIPGWECTRCARGCGPFKKCVVMLVMRNDGERQFLSAACQNCHYHRKNTLCSFRISYDDAMAADDDENDDDDDEDEDDDEEPGGKKKKGRKGKKAVGQKGVKAEGKWAASAVGAASSGTIAV